MRFLNRVRKHFAVFHRHFATGSKTIWNGDRMDAISPLEFREMLSDIGPSLDLNRHKLVGQYPLAVALSGGADSLTLTLLLDEYLRECEQKAASLLAITVDHQLRAESREEAEYVHKICEERGIAHVIASNDWSAFDSAQLVDGKPKKSQIQVQARKYRYSSLEHKCRKVSVKYLFVGHTLDDQEETILYRLARGSGVNGLAGMDPITKWFWNEEMGEHIYLIRPLLSVPKSRLQQTCMQRFHQDWIEDPSNHSDTFDRVRIRKVMAMIRGDSGEGAFDSLLPLQQIATEAKKNFRKLENKALEKHITEWSPSRVTLDVAFQDGYEELIYRVLIRILCYVGKKEHPPRHSSVSKVLHDLDQLTCGKQITIHGCVVKKVEKGRLLCFQPEHRRTESFDPFLPCKMTANYMGLASQLLVISPMTSYILRMKRYSKRVRVMLAIAFLVFVAAYSIASEHAHPKSNLYSLMGISRDASPNDIKRAFRARSVELHPDKNPSENAEEEFNRLRAAFDILSNAEKRRTYDNFGEDAIDKDAMQLMMETSLKSFSFYAIWAVMAYFFTLKEENKRARSWVYCGQVMLFIFEINLLFGSRDFEPPFSFFSFMTIHEFVTAIHSAFPFFMNGCRAISIFFYRDITQENLALGFELLKSNKQIALEIRELKSDIISMQRRPIRDTGGTTASIESVKDTTLTKRSKLTKSVAKPMEKDVFAKEKELATPVPQVPAPQKIKIPLYAVVIVVLVIAKYLFT